MTTSFLKDSTGTWYINKDPQAVLDYTLDWADPKSSWLGDDVILSVDWTVETGIVKNAESHTETKATIWLSGGTDGTSYKITCRVTTAGGRVDDRSFKVVCKEK